MIVCNDCKKTFNDDEAIYCAEYTNMIDDRPVYEWYECPHCRSDDLSEANECECGEYKDIEQPFCEKCKKDILKKFETMMLEFTPKERDYLNEFYDGKYF